MGKLRFFAAAALLALGAAACSNNTPTTPTSGGTTPAGTSPASTSSPLNDHGTKDIASMTEFSLELDDNYFEPTFMKVKDGQKLKIELENEGSNQHNFTITALNINEDLAPGAKKDVEVTFPGTADVPFFCRFHGPIGMRGAFFFGSTPTASGTASGGGGGY